MYVYSGLARALTVSLSRVLFRKEGGDEGALISRASEWKNPGVKDELHGAGTALEIEIKISWVRVKSQGVRFGAPTLIEKEKKRLTPPEYIHSYSSWFIAAPTQADLNPLTLTRDTNMTLTFLYENPPVWNEQKNKHILVYFFYFFGFFFAPPVPPPLLALLAGATAFPYSTTSLHKV